MRTLDTDYLVIGGGAAGLAFTDTLVSETDAQVTIVDRQSRPGGHWAVAYPFVTLHQPSAFYGVNSLELGSGRKDTRGLNQGLYELATGAQICSYYERVLDRLIDSGRVRYLPMSNHVEEGGRHRIESLLSTSSTAVTVRRKVVDAAYHSPGVPATHRRAFAVAPGVRCVAPGALPGLWHLAQAAPPLRQRFVVLGAGKTAMDTCVWLLQSGAEPDSITWVVPRDAWLIDRTTTQTSPEFFQQVIGSQADQMQAFAQATSIDDLYLRLERCGALLRIDPTRTPSMFHLATVSAAEVGQLRRIHDVVRLGRVLALEPGAMVLQHGRVACEPGTLFVDCTASAVMPRPLLPIFQGNRIVLQMVRLPQPTFSAALTAWVEAHVDGEAERNELCASVPFPHTLDAYPAAALASMRNQARWGQHKELRQWMRDSRLDGFGKLMAGVGRDDAGKQAVLLRLREHTGAAMANLQRLAVREG